MELTVDIIKELLSNLDNPGKCIINGTGIDENDDGYTKTLIFQTKYDDICMKITYHVDSYGEGNDRINSIKFVKPIKKQVTDFESI